ncbi:TIGR03943 family putative permease subunit [Candidatus Contubernalis alkaliaceticus]|uniref:TIGR03943 family putative permease subunit n=1 Tax=Candidatus Contubernalis alkaliaceticus TaxID=338645 RepID=UPI001F4C0271|nr:TIGR03943 family protein [Candidatus Contubernalis alkalaceticus]UNC93108.1 TIGR03943 family protein [Candidatus Contubernalis alkalaceticus]
MNFFKKRIINIEALLKIVVLLGFFIFLLTSINSGQIYLYINPKMVIYVKLGMVVMFIVAVVTFGEIFRIPRKKTSFTTFALFFLPLITLAAFSPVSIQSSDLPGREINVGRSENRQVQEDDYDEYFEDDQHVVQDIELDIKEWEEIQTEDSIVLDDTNYYSWLFVIYYEIEKYVDKEIELVGFVYRDDTHTKNEFVVARLAMVCCAADMQVIGLLVRDEEDLHLEQDTWVKVKGILKKDEFMGDTLPIVELVSVEEVEKPQWEYIYPFPTE